MIRVRDLDSRQDECYATLADAMDALVARYPEAVFSDIDFEHEPTIWVWPSNDASKYADEREAVASLRMSHTP
jgi:hypothetical protein